jgi:hypothetical protein
MVVALTTTLRESRQRRAQHAEVTQIAAWPCVGSTERESGWTFDRHNLRSRTHLALAKDSPVPRPVQSASAGRIVTTPEVGGLHHRYDRVAA